MKSIATLCSITLGLVLPAMGQANPTLETAAPSMPPCWLDHTQIQPGGSFLKPAPGGNASGIHLWKQVGSRPGAEHWNIVELRRACRNQWTGGMPTSDVAAEFLTLPNR